MTRSNRTVHLHCVIGGFGIPLPPGTSSVTPVVTSPTGQVPIPPNAAGGSVPSGVTPLDLTTAPSTNSSGLKDHADKDKAAQDKATKDEQAADAAEADLVKAARDVLGIRDSSSLLDDITQAINEFSPKARVALFKALEAGIRNGTFDKNDIENFNDTLNRSYTSSFSSAPGADAIRKLITMSVVGAAYLPGSGLAQRNITTAGALVDSISSGVDAGPLALEVVPFVGAEYLLGRLTLPLVARMGRFASTVKGIIEAGKSVLGIGCPILRQHSFAASTPVMTAKGLVAIGALSIGTQVLAYNEATEKNEYDPITQVFKNQDPAITYLTLRSSQGDEPIITTPEHPFYVRSGQIGKRGPGPSATRT